jgi:4-hydroxy-tetrahydrodipicolinate synthase
VKLSYWVPTPVLQPTDEEQTSVIKLDDNFLKGSITPIMTPFRDGKVDHDAYASLVERHINEGGHGILVNGTTAEPSTLSVRERNEIVDTAISVAGNRTQIVVASGSQSHAETIELSEYADKAGAQALLIVTPYYIKPPQRGLVSYYLDMAQRIDLPIMIYHIPGRAAVAMKKESVFEIAEKAENFVGIKHASLDLGFVSDCLQELGPEFRIFVGLEELSFPMLAMGASGLMNAVGNLFPKQVAELYEAAASGDMAKGRKLHYEMLELNRAVFFDTNPIPMKYMAKRLGILETNEHRLPMVPATPELEKRLDRVLVEAGLL